MLHADGNADDDRKEDAAHNAWELASLCILGFTRWEGAKVLLAELTLELGIGIPLGGADGQWSHPVHHVAASE
jgi:hypothetical protein